MARRQSFVEIQAEQAKMTASCQVPHPPASPSAPPLAKNSIDCHPERSDGPASPRFGLITKN
jgi:hypothetical protein